MTMRFTAMAALAALIACLLTTAGSLHLGAAASASVHAPARAAAMQMFLDPVTGLQREPTAEELTALHVAAQANAKASLRPGATAPEEVQLPDGTVGIRINHEYDDTIVVCQQPDGHFDDHCQAAGATR